ncbi:hypothetical protein ACFVKB_27750 [Rhodococcus sp. NPDC127530]|uniref:hypothetical protein n=1 Tax=unclassified Rhodococcus (in: high G+C Gram-positive bacteria) TaxID=192944 RepID=UPI00363CC27C
MRFPVSADYPPDRPRPDPNDYGAPRLDHELRIFALGCVQRHRETELIHDCRGILRANVLNGEPTDPATGIIDRNHGSGDLLTARPDDFDR